MLRIILEMLNLWDPYNIYLFPDDEYICYALKINEFIKCNNNVNEETLVDYVYNILPPTLKFDVNDVIAKVEYFRFAKLLLLLLNSGNCF